MLELIEKAIVWLPASPEGAGKHRACYQITLLLQKLIHESVSTRNFTSHYKEPEQVVCDRKVLYFKNTKIIFYS